MTNLALLKQIKIKTTGVHVRHLRHVIWSMYDDREYPQDQKNLNCTSLYSESIDQYKELAFDFW